MKRGAVSFLLGIMPVWLWGCSQTCVIDSDPQGATIFVDGAPIGQTPTSYDFSIAGLRFSYEIKAQLTGYETEVQVVKSHTDAYGTTAWPDNIFFRLRQPRR